MHEYGHLLQSRKLIFHYIPIVGIPSLINASVGDDHKHQWYEIQASQYAKAHFTQKYGDGVWTQSIEDKHPTSK